MKTISKLLAISVGFLAPIVHAADSNGTNNITGIPDKRLRNGDVHFEDVSTVIIHVTNWLLGISGTLAVFAIIYGAFRIGIGAVPGDKDTGKKIIQGAVIGFVLAASSWLIINTIISNL